MTILEAIRSLIRVPATIYRGAGRVYNITGMLVRVTSSATSALVRPYEILATVATRTLIACRRACTWAISQRGKIVKMFIIFSFLSAATLVLFVACPYYANLYINHEL
jgi:hypothetical protein